MTETRGGSRPGAGRKKKAPTEKKKPYSVQLTKPERDHLVKKHSSLTIAIRTLLPKPKQS